MKAEHISLSYGDKIIYDDFSLDFPERCCIMAASGRGKTSLLMMIAGLLKPQSGCISDAPKKPAMLFQEDRLLPWLNVLDNASLASDDRQCAKDVLNSLGLGDELQSYPDTLSGGMQRRVALARALAYRGDYLILDEPFKGMDFELKKSVADLIDSCSEKYIVSLHSEEDAALFNAVLIRI